MAKFKLSIGDIFSIPLDNGFFGFGQVVTDYDKTSGGFMIAIYDLKIDNLDAIELRNFGESELLFLGFTFDAKLYHKQWKVIGNNLENIKKIKMPYFRIGLPSNDAYLINYKDENLIKINDDFFKKLDYKSEIAPVRYENALKAHFGLQEWKEDYDELLYKKTLESNKIAQEILKKVV